MTWVIIIKINCFGLELRILIIIKFHLKNRNIANDPVIYDDNLFGLNDKLSEMTNERA